MHGAAAIMALRFENNGEKQRTPAKKKRSRNISFYAALAMCVAAVVLTAVANPADSGDRTADTLSEIGSGQSADYYTDNAAVNQEITDTWYVNQVTPPTQVADTAVPTSAVTDTQPTLPVSELTVAISATSAAVPAAASVSFRMPVDGSITCGFSGEELVFFSTMCDWRVHNGLDISGPAGNEVYACAGGIVEGFVEDMLYGNTAIIRHADDSVMYYCGLDDTQMVSAGLIVEAGDVIGYIGEVPCELSDGSHVHLALMKDGQFIDPATVIAGS